MRPLGEIVISEYHDIYITVFNRVMLFIERTSKKIDYDQMYLKSDKQSEIVTMCPLDVGISGNVK